MDNIIVAARPSPLSKAQFYELAALVPHLSLKPLWIPSHGDLDQKTSLRSLGKTDFFTRELDQALLAKQCHIALHSAKDLPDPLPTGLQLIALTRGVDASDSLVLPQGIALEELPMGACIATSSLKRQEAVLALRKDLSFCDLRGPIHKRLSLVETGKVSGVVIAEAALIRLQLTHLPRLPLPGPTTALQGQLAIVARATDTAMDAQFARVDVRRLPKALYLGPELPTYAFPEYQWVHHPLIALQPLPIDLSAWDSYTHLICTSRQAMKILAEALRLQKKPLHLERKTCLAVGKATEALLRQHGAQKVWTAQEECAEGLIEYIQQEKHGYFFWPHSRQARPVLLEALQNRRFDAPILYEPIDTKNPLPPLEAFTAILFSSPSTVKAFFMQQPNIPPTLTLKSIGKITKQAFPAYL